MRVPLELQRSLYARHAEAAVDLLLARLHEQRARLVQLGASRAFSDVGVGEYGDATYWLTPERLSEETDAELADAIFYAQIAIAREAGELPSDA
jgi:hypothetical protein